VLIVRRECPRPGHWGMDAFAPAVLCGNLVATCTQDRCLCIWIYPWISTEKSVDVGMDMDEKFHIHGKPVSYIPIEFGQTGNSAIRKFLNPRSVVKIYLH